MEKVDYKKTYKSLYLPKQTPEIIDIPPIPFAIIEGEGDPNGPEFATNTGALYALSYAVKMSYKSADIPLNYYDYTVFPLEGVWDLIDLNVSHTVKSNLKYKLMIRQPDFLTEALFKRFIAEAKKKTKNEQLDKVTFKTISEGTCCQIMHIGSYDDEPATFSKMEQFCQENKYNRLTKVHREIYLSDPRKSEPAKMKTVLRIQVEKSML